MQSGRLILLDGLLYFVVYGNLLSVYNFFYALSVSVFTRNLSGNSNGIEVVLLLYCQCDQSAILRTSFALASVVTILPFSRRAVT